MVFGDNQGILLHFDSILVVIFQAILESGIFDVIYYISAHVRKPKLELEERGLIFCLRDHDVRTTSYQMLVDVISQQGLARLYNRKYGGRRRMAQFHF